MSLLPYLPAGGSHETIIRPPADGTADETGGCLIRLASGEASKTWSITIDGFTLDGAGLDVQAAGEKKQSCMMRCLLAG